MRNGLHFVRKRCVGFDAFSSCEADSTSLENAVLDLTDFAHANRILLRLKTLRWVGRISIHARWSPSSKKLLQVPGTVVAKAVMSPFGRLSRICWPSIM